MCESSSRTLDEQLDRVLALRDAALQLLQRDGEWMEVEGYPGRVRSYENDSLMMLHRTPFQPPPLSQAAMAAGVTAAQQQAAARDYGLDIWLQNKKVLSLIWNDTATMHVVMYRPGAWEQPLLDT